MSLICFQVVRRDLIQALRKKRPGMAQELENIILHQDNAPAHTAVQTTLEIDLLGFERISHPPYSPDLAPMDFALFPAIKSQLRGMKFDNLGELKLEVSRIISKFDKQWFQNVFKSWVQRHEKCISCDGRYFEKE